jgi:hypothetical protein
MKWHCHAPDRVLTTASSAALFHRFWWQLGSLRTPDLDFVAQVEMNRWKADSISTRRRLGRFEDAGSKREAASEGTHAKPITFLSVR